MPKFGKTSKKRLNTCDTSLQDLFNEVVRYFDCSVLIGHRGEKEQNEAFDKGNSQVRWPDGKHNSNPSTAIDIAPYSIDWDDRERFTYFAGYVMGIAEYMGIPLRWGGDWDSDNDLSDNNFDDLVHFELK